MDDIGLLRKLVSINSIFPNEREIAVFLEGQLKASGFKVRRLETAPGRFNLLAERGSKGNPIGFYGHMDTVPAYGTWAADPFVLRSEGDKLMGLGAWDMKAGAAAIVEAVRQDSGRRIKVVFGVDEENDSAGAHAIARDGFLNDVEGLIVTEGMNTEPGKPGGPGALGLGRRGRGVYSIEISGQPAHGAVKKGASAARVASEIVQFLETQGMRRHEMLPPASQFVRKIHSEVEGLTIPDKAIIELDRHLVPPETFESVRKELDKCLEKFRKNKNGDVRISVTLKPRTTPYLAPYVTDQNNEFVKKICNTIRARYGSVSFNYGYSVADENIFAAKGIPVVVISPDGGNDHSPEEWVSKNSYLELIKVLRGVIKG